MRPKCNDPEHVRVPRTRGSGTYCQTCSREYARARYAADPEKCLAIARKSRAKHKDKYRNFTHLKRLYGISEEQYEHMERLQEGRCYICDKECRTRKRLAVDHCHKTKRVRKLLCLRCNSGIGQLQDDPEILLKAYNYLKEHEDGE